MKEEIKKFFKGEMEDGEEILSKYSRDASIFEIKPQLVLFPMDSEDVKNLVKWVSENKEKYPNIAITPRCAGTDMSGGSIGESLILDFTRHMNKLIGGPLPLLSSRTTKLQKFKNYPLVDSSITVEPGMFYRDFEKITLEKGLILPCYTASKSLNAVGGMFGNNSAGEKTLRYGQTENYVLESKVVFADGNEYTVKPLSQKELEEKIRQNDFEGNLYKKIYTLINEHKEEIENARPKVHKNSAGYYLWNVCDWKNLSSPQFFNLNKLLVGSQGTLGIVTEITFKILPKQKYSKLVAIFLNDLTPLGRIVDDVLELHPETLETYDDKTMKLAVKFFFDFLKNKGLLGMWKLFWSFLPEFKMMLSQGFPKLILLAEFSGEGEEQTDKQCKSLVQRLAPYNLKIHITKDQAESEKYWSIRRESFSLLRKHVKGLHTAPFIDDIIVRPEFLPKFLPELNKILGKYKLLYTIAGHVGDGNFHIIPLMDFSKKETSQIISELGEQVYDLVLQYQGSITAEHNDGFVRTPFLQKMYGEYIFNLFKQVKCIFDIKNIFNPGKKTPSVKGQGTKDYLISHIALEHDAEHKS